MTIEDKSGNWKWDRVEKDSGRIGVVTIDTHAKYIYNTIGDADKSESWI